MKQRVRKLTLQFAMIAIMLFANLPMYSGNAEAEPSPTVSSYAMENTVSTATLVAYINGIQSIVASGIKLSLTEDLLDFSDIPNLDGTNASTTRTAHLTELTPGTTYYFYAYANDGESTYKSEIRSFTTAAIQAIDVAIGSGAPLTKTLVSSSSDQTVYAVHVPYSTAKVNVSETVYLGSSYVFLPLEFAKVGNYSSDSANWNNTADWIKTATYEDVELSSNVTKVCVSTPIFGGPSGGASTIENCNGYPYEVQIIRDAPTVQTLPVVMNTDKTAYLTADAPGFIHIIPAESPTIGFEFDQNADMSTKQDISSNWINMYDSNFYQFLEDDLLTPGTTYFYRAFVQDGETRYLGGIESFTTAAFTGIDVKPVGGGNAFAKSPSVFNTSQKLYTVHVPYNTTSVTVAQNVYLGTAQQPAPAEFAVVDLDSYTKTENWSQPPVLGNITANHQVAVTSNLTTVCLNAPVFQSPGNIEGPIGSCKHYDYEVQIIRDAAPQESSPATPPKTVKVIVTEQSGTVANVPVTQLGESKLPMSAQLFTTDGKSLNLPDIAIAADGTFSLPNVPAGQYHMVLNVVAPTGEKLAGRPATLTVDASGNAQVESELIDPYGIITDTVTGKVIEGAHATLHWADTALNRSKGRTVDALVILPILPDFAPNQNKDPQDSNAKGEYGWMVFPDGDYYILATKAGYNAFDSRTTGANKDDGDDSYIKNGIIHIGQSIESYDFAMEPIAKETGTHNNYIAGYPDGTFGPDRNITRAEVAAVFARITNDYQLVLHASDSNNFNDVSDSHWAKEYIENVRANGLMLGSTEGSFLPEAPITRGEVAAIVARFKKLAPVEEPLFSDTADSWASSAINAVKKANIIDGYGDGTFLPNQNIVRKEFVIMINRMLGRGKLQNATEQLWSDVPATNFYFADIQEASTTHQYAIYADGLERLKK
ncbi:S-layer homology domain-containing protein [Paenibacillus qinlingensis]|uniref:S-layer homology domain-containing protein n=1 Tax=Paenibacillus qinlingensis TaxID=1837343 RepID=UPI0015659EBE|nr:S-layer homology domain-containing protein [Paenibacillus qinlingensis]NQX62813.1 S-layer homology domain-containing protein [Paenibacillus qinlingensis]